MGKMKEFYFDETRAQRVWADPSLVDGARKLCVGCLLKIAKRSAPPVGSSHPESETTRWVNALDPCGWSQGLCDNCDVSLCDACPLEDNDSDDCLDCDLAQSLRRDFSMDKNANKQRR